MRLRYRTTRGTETGCAFIAGLAFVVMGVWLLFYGLQYLWYIVFFLGIGGLFAGFSGILLLNQARWEKKGKGGARRL